MFPSYDLGEEFSGEGGPHPGQAADEGRVRVAFEQPVKFAIQIAHAAQALGRFRVPERMAPGLAEPLYDRFCARLAASGVPVARGRFGADMQVELVNDGPVTLLLDSKKLF